MQLQDECQCPILQWNTSAFAQVGLQASQRFLGNHHPRSLVGLRRLLDVHLLQVNIDEVDEGLSFKIDDKYLKQSQETYLKSRK